MSDRFGPGLVLAECDVLLAWGDRRQYRGVDRQTFHPNPLEIEGAEKLAWQAYWAAEDSGELWRSISVARDVAAGLQAWVQLEIIQVEVVALPARPTYRTLDWLGRTRPTGDAPWAFELLGYDVSPAMPRSTR